MVPKRARASTKNSCLSSVFASMERRKNIEVIKKHVGIFGSYYYGQKITTRQAILLVAVPRYVWQMGSAVSPKSNNIPRMNPIWTYVKFPPPRAKSLMEMMPGFFCMTAVLMNLMYGPSFRINFTGRFTSKICLTHTWASLCCPLDVTIQVEPSKNGTDPSETGNVKFNEC